MTIRNGLKKKSKKKSLIRKLNIIHTNDVTDKIVTLTSNIPSIVTKKRRKK